MKSSVILHAFVAAVQAVYPGDIVQYWVDQSAILVNSTVVGGLPSPPSARFPAIVHASIYQAALQTSSQSHAGQQLAVSHAAHDALAWTFQGVRLNNQIDAALRNVLPAIGISQSSNDYRRLAHIGQEAAARVTAARSNDGLSNFVDYAVQPALPGVYQPTPGGRPLPDTPQAQFIRSFGGIEDLTAFRLPAPPTATARGYDGWVDEIILLGVQNSTNRTSEQTEIAYFWQESSVIGWSRFANAIIGNRLANNVVASARTTSPQCRCWLLIRLMFHPNHWRPVTAIHREGVWLRSGRNVYDPGFVPLLRPTPSHPDYPSTHATFGAAAAAVLKAFNRGDNIPNIGFSSNVTLDARGVITRRFNSIDAAAQENSRSRIYGGIHFTYAGDQGIALGTEVAEATLALFDEHWDNF
ncbi:hypothetical protein S40288_11619 [Stachybotrys chartarum IBT 40288]|nr:hypothetical protein S40288_11619 [Stachybotrys chartarum IBT 40288]